MICTEATATSQASRRCVRCSSARRTALQPAPASCPSSRPGSPAVPELLAGAEEYLKPLQQADIDTLILGCTHYPLLTGVISYVLGDNVSLVSSAEVRQDVYAVLTRRGLTLDQPRFASLSILDHGQPGGI